MGWAPLSVRGRGAFGGSGFYVELFIYMLEAWLACVAAYRNNSPILTSPATLVAIWAQG